MTFPPQRIAILDDDHSVRTAITRLLKTAGMDAVCHASSRTLFNALEREEPPDCLVLDLQMPGMTGLDVLQYLRHANIRVPIVIITAHDELGSPAACLAAGASAYLRKPLDADELICAIGNAILAFKEIH
jgi:FixJ family two-component response regulator